jgi:hypothetical protein
MAVLIAVAVKSTGEREVVGVDVGPAEDHQFFRHPCLDVLEVRRLASWLDQACTGQRSEALGFTEPNLRFELRSFSDEAVVVRVYFEMEARPRWRHEGFVDGQDPDCFIDVDVTTASLKVASHDLLRQLGKLESPRSLGSTTAE